MSGIIRAPRPERGWTEIQNSTLRDSRLSYRARGVLARLLSNADGFRMTAHDLAEESPGEGRQAVLTALSELRNAGYIVQRRRQDARGRWTTETFVHDTPQTEVRLPDSGSPDAGSPDAGSPDAGSPDRIEKEQQKKQQYKQRTPKRESGGPKAPRRRALTRPLSGGGGDPKSSYITDPTTGICLQVGNAADDAALAEIKQRPPQAIAAAVASARAADPLGRAWPTSVLRALRRAAGAVGGDDAPAWARRRTAAAPRTAAREIDITDQGEKL